ncbi:MAG: hypothetical protein HC879_02490 [Leptolyngbyaceae cyanobacterium SL_5_9]|nr:hypothetical protein [Leptolyngbyaceae cyanobacterium SL_5_9]NJO73044.1 hypothetical protein [Leptolyngbyaceae cyanobacterium RM1_406_9]
MDFPHSGNASGRSAIALTKCNLASRFQIDVARFYVGTATTAAASGRSRFRLRQLTPGQDLCILPENKGLKPLVCVAIA